MRIDYNKKNNNSQSPLVLDYFDDLTLGGVGVGVGVLTADVETIERECRELWLSLNHAKCEIITHQAHPIFPVPLIMAFRLPQRRLLSSWELHFLT